MNDFWVVIPAFDEAAGITHTLEALAAQRDSNFSVVVVDNLSKDATVAVVSAFAALHPEMHLDIISEKQKGTGSAADTGMRYAAGAGAKYVARTDADCVPAPDWILRLRAAFADGLELIAGRLVPRRDEGLTRWEAGVLRYAVTVAATFGKFRTGNQDPSYLGPYVMTAGCNMAITAELYLAVGGFPRSRIEDLHEDRALVNAVRKRTTAYGSRPEVLVFASSRRAKAWGLRNTLAWYADHRYRPAVVDIR